MRKKKTKPKVRVKKQSDKKLKEPIKIPEIEKDFYESEIDFIPIKPKDLDPENNKIYMKKNKPFEVDNEIIKKLAENEKYFIKNHLRNKMYQNLENEVF